MKDDGILMAKVERVLQPAFEFITVANKIDFDDNILQCMTYFINAQEEISETMGILFHMIKNSFEKNNFIFKEFFNLIRAYCKHGRQFLEADVS